MVVIEAEARSIKLTHPQTEIKQRDTKIYVVRREEIPQHPRVATNLNNQSVYKVYISQSCTTKSLNKTPPKCHSTNTIMTLKLNPLYRYTSINVIQESR